MRVFILIIITLILIIPLFSNEFEVTNYDSIQDTKLEELNKYLLHNITQGNRNYALKYQSIIASFVGALFAGLIAFFSIRATNKNNILLQKEEISIREEDSINRYCGLIYAVNVSLILDQNISNSLETQIRDYLEIITSNPEINIDSPFTIYSTNFTKACQIEILKFHNFNFEILTQLSYYISKIEALNENLNLHNVNEIKNLFSGEEEYSEAINHYFDSIKTNLAKSKDIRAKLKSIIRKDIDSFPTTNVYFDDKETDTNNA